MPVEAAQSEAPLPQTVVLESCTCALSMHSVHGQCLTSAALQCICCKACASGYNLAGMCHAISSCFGMVRLLQQARGMAGYLPGCMGQERCSNPEPWNMV